MNSNTSGAAVATEQTLTESERELALVFLQQTQNGIVGAIKGMSSDQWRFTPGADRWSIAEIAEHVIFVTELVGGPTSERLAAAPAPPADRDYALVDSIVIHQFPTRLAKFPAPEFSRPAGKFASPAEAMGGVEKAYAILRQRLDSPELRMHWLEAPPLKAVTKGVHQSMDGYQWILAAAAHCERHTKQILEVRADPNFPA
jgi:hypothetical protein